MRTSAELRETAGICTSGALPRLSAAREADPSAGSTGGLLGAAGAGDPAKRNPPGKHLFSGRVVLCVVKLRVISAC